MTEERDPDTGGFVNKISDLCGEVAGVIVLSGRSRNNSSASTKRFKWRRGAGSRLISQVLALFSDFSGPPSGAEPAAERSPGLKD